MILFLFSYLAIEIIQSLLPSQGWRSGESTHLTLMCPRFDSILIAIHRLSLLVLCSAPRGFSVVTMVFPSHQENKKK